MRIIAPILLAAGALAASGCIYKLEVQQGNVVAQESVSKLKKGMSKSEVRGILGTPLLMDPFHGNRWDYFFSTETRGRVQERNKFSVFFENDKLVSITGDIKAASAVSSATGPAGTPGPAAPAAPGAAPAKSAPPAAPAKPAPPSTATK